MMNTNEYLEKIMEQQTFAPDAPELESLRRWRDEVKSLLREDFPTSSIRWGGSMAKGTMIRESYDGDVTCYLPHDEDVAGKTLSEIYDNVARTLAERFAVERKRSALRVKDPSTQESKGFPEDLHIDVVPGRFTGDENDDVFLHQENGEKERLKTNLQVHVNHIRESGVRPAIRLMKLWNVRNGIRAKTFVLELLVVELLKQRKTAGLDRQLEHVWTELRDHPATLAVEDPANPSGNDLRPLLDEARGRLSSVAATTLHLIEESEWEAVFGPLDDEEDGEERKAALDKAASAVVIPTRPWLPGR